MSASIDDIREVFEAQGRARWRVAGSSAAERVDKLERLRDALWAHRTRLHDALAADFSKHPGETDLTELLPLVGEINHTIRNLAEWMRPRRVRTPRILTGTRSEIRYEPLGRVLILAPWNYPVNLLLGPLVAALAAGNVVMLRPSEKVPRTAAALAHLLAEIFEQDEVALVQGGVEVAEALLDLPFDHIFFTGSTAVGRKVMAAASRHLASVTLELGGKSPAVVDRTADLRKAAERILWGKFVNAGQTCVAPDYVLIHESRLGEFLAHAGRVIEERYGRNPEVRRKNDSYCRMISPEHHQGLVELLEQALEVGGTIEFGGASDAGERYLEPTIVTGVTPDSPLMRREIFGPILPVLTYRRLEEAVDLIRSMDKPLALYVFSRDNGPIEYVLQNTTAGGSSVNTVMVHLANNELPFGGVGPSGQGSYHGQHGFRAMSHERSVLVQGRLDTLKMFYPPYTDRVRGLIEKAARYLS